MKTSGNSLPISSRKHTYHHVTHTLRMLYWVFVLLSFSFSIQMTWRQKNVQSMLSVTTDNYEEKFKLHPSFEFNEKDFHKILAQFWNQSLSAQEGQRVFVMVTEPTEMKNETTSLQNLVTTISFVLQWNQATVAYVHDPKTAMLLAREFWEAIFYQSQLQIFLSPRQKQQQQLDPQLQNDFDFAYLLDLANQSKATFAHFLTSGTHPQHSFFYRTNLNLLEQYLKVETNVLQKDAQARLCYAHFGNNPTQLSGLFMRTKPHTHRLSIILRSYLPYYHSSHDLLNFYCDSLWNTRHVELALLEDPAKAWKPMRTIKEKQLFVDSNNLVAPSWINEKCNMGPRNMNQVHKFKVTFAIPSARRPSNDTDYLQQCIQELINVISKNFIGPNNEKQAEILILVSGNTHEELESYHDSISTTFRQEIQSQYIRLAKAPIEKYGFVFDEIHCFHNQSICTHNDSQQRTFWRTKQNLDVSAAFEAAGFHSEFVMLVEDDTGFWPDFGAHLRSLVDNNTGTIPEWSSIHYGFGYSGILIHNADVGIYQHIHQALASEQPCDWINVPKFIRAGQTMQINTDAHSEPIFLRHYGKQSTLKEKDTMPTW